MKNKEQSKLERAIELVKMLPEFVFNEIFLIDEWVLRLNEDCLWVCSSCFITSEVEFTKAEDAILTSLIADLERHLGIEEEIKVNLNNTKDATLYLAEKIDKLYSCKDRVTFESNLDLQVGKSFYHDDGRHLILVEIGKREEKELVEVGGGDE